MAGNNGKFHPYLQELWGTHASQSPPGFLSVLGGSDSNT